MQKAYVASTQGKMEKNTLYPSNVSLNQISSVVICALVCRRSAMRLVISRGMLSQRLHRPLALDGILDQSNLPAGGPAQDFDWT